MYLQQYIREKFIGIDLFEDSFVDKEFAIHIQFEKELYQFKEGSDELNHYYFRNVYQKATEVFEGIFEEEDELYLVLHQRRDVHSNKYKKINFFSRYLKNQQNKYKVRYTQREMECGDQIIQYELSLFHKKEIHYKMLIKAMCNQDFRGLKPRFNDKDSYYPEIFFINKSKGIILNIYDDRGCFIVVNNEDDLKYYQDQYKSLLIKNS
ncbi:DUF3885 domain-containing protein [Bacillus sp. RO3]|nr:DUF3885 domain-containing protein [Bacillus sp. RO3]